MNVAGRTFWRVIGVASFTEAAREPHCDDGAVGLLYVYRGDEDTKDEAWRKGWEADYQRTLTSGRYDLGFVGLLLGLKKIPNPLLADRTWIPFDVNMKIPAWIDRPEWVGALRVTPWGACAFWGDMCEYVES